MVVGEYIVSGFTNEYTRYVCIGHKKKNLFIKCSWKVKYFFLSFLFTPVNGLLANSWFVIFMLTSMTAE